MMAIRIGYLAKGSISFQETRPEKYIGTIEREPAAHKSPSKLLIVNTCIVGLIISELIRGKSHPQESK